MKIAPHIFVIGVVVFIGWCFAETGWLNSRNHKGKVVIKASYSPELSQRGLPLSTCTDCYTVDSRNRYTLRYRGTYLYDQHNDFVYIESLHDFIIVIGAVVIATSWVTIFALILHIPDREIRPEGTCSLGGDEAWHVPEGRISQSGTQTNDT